MTTVVPILDTPTEATRGQAPVVDVSAWAQVDLADLVATLPLRRSRFAGSPGERLLVDVRYRPPLVETLLGAMIPEGEVWILAGPDAGHWRLSLTGDLIDGSGLLTAPPMRVAEAAVSPEARVPSALPVRLVARSGSPGPADALLLDDDELIWLRRFLMTRPSGERAFLIPGGERHLLASPGGLMGTLPFGVTLRRIGPGCLYVESGIGKIADVLRQQEIQHELRGKMPAARPVTEEDRSQLLEDAQKAEIRGDLVEAAGLLEKAGELGPAGRLYKRAAMAGR